MPGRRVPEYEWFRLNTVLPAGVRDTKRHGPSTMLHRGLVPYVLTLRRAWLSRNLYTAFAPAGERSAEPVLQLAQALSQASGNGVICDSSLYRTQWCEYLRSKTNSIREESMIRVRTTLSGYAPGAYAPQW